MKPFETSPRSLDVDGLNDLRRRFADEPLPVVIQRELALDDGGYLVVVSGLLDLPALDAAALENAEPRFDLLSYADCLAHECLLLDVAEGRYKLALGNPFDLRTRNAIARCLSVPFERFVAHPSIVADRLEYYESSQRAMSQLDFGALVAGALDRSSEISLASIALDSNPVIKLINSTLYDALKAKASDIHLETSASGMTVKYRIDGVLLHAGAASGIEVAEQVISRVKVLAELDISERRTPQDGRFKVNANGRDVDFRVSIMPSIHGEDAVLRVLDRRNDNGTEPLRLDSLGHDATTMAGIRSLSAEPYGLLLVTGPTGSGKSTTLYAALSEINTGQEKIITIEDPVEYELHGVLQIPVNDRKGLTFARGLRSILRHDPDKILVGEIRDGETAAIAVQAALTGHLVLTSVHANGVFSVLDRFLHMGVEPHGLIDALVGIVAQRLIRKICPHCADDARPDDALLHQSALSDTEVAAWRFRAGRGCAACRHTGYLGRIAVAEVLRFNDPLKELFLARAPISEQKALARQHGFASVRETALRRVAQGSTTLQEVNRVTVVE
ncbi:GspE/PulE family protein [Pararobbsia alpina]|uniref:Bacterial type II secretion system protein E domain-containing protein n=1 Tax=Pararobbsia alpina TaxID=621374 RepID=A0A6S7ASA9_9BURK|nr:GspE/PulE family protein [Pararobbsia alpina]CAB3776269.1 hypothetical protein LMG28138_00116 [Pararobbsia alpina]